MQILFMIVLVLEITFLGLWFYHRRKQKHLLRENGNLRMERELVIEHYTALSQYINMTKKCSGDMEHQMQTLENLLKITANNNEPETDKTKIVKEEGFKLLYCEEWMTNAIITHKVNLCKEMGILSEIEVLMFDIDWMLKSDFFSLLYNLFDNAIEACQKMEAEKKRFLNFRLYEEGVFLILCMENTYLEVLQSKGRIITDKKNKSLHGVGLSILESIAQRYHGNVVMVCEDHICKTEVRLRRE